MRNLTMFLRNEFQQLSIDAKILKFRQRIKNVIKE